MDIRQRITAKLQCPELFDPGTEVERCLPWPTKAPIFRHTLRMVRAYDESPYMAPVTLKTRPRIMFEGERHEVIRLIMSLLHPDCFIGRSAQLCRSPFCVNPAHWHFQAMTPAEHPEEGPPEPSDEDWTLSDVRELLDMYLTRCPYPPLDLEHDLMIDVPIPLLLEALALIQKEDYLP